MFVCMLLLCFISVKDQKLVAIYTDKYQVNKLYIDNKMNSKNIL